MSEDRNAQPSSAGFQHQETPSGLCHVCGSPLDGTDTALCGRCDRPFHLLARQHAEGEDCGDVWLNEQYLAMDFLCDVCLGKRQGHAGEEPPVASGH